ncbi:MAG: DUF3108 domain-containing protein [Gemmatimonadaceae bacterium]|nr:DUF3108 domain-containing protein [Acetobacteraceae bacterium]
MKAIVATLALCLAPLPAAAQSQPVRVHYEAYATGFNVARMDADFTVGARDYRVKLAFQTAGTLRAMVRSEGESVVEGTFAGDRPVPRQYFSFGNLRGRQRVTQIDYPGGRPSIRTLTPPNEEEREPVPASDQAGTVDSLSAMAMLVRQVNATGRCEGRSRTYDGRRLAELTVRTVGQEVLDLTNRSSFSGPALRCDFEGRQIGGFMLDADRAALERPQRASAWFAAVTPGGPMIPVRIRFETRIAGDVLIYVAPPPS